MTKPDIDALPDIDKERIKRMIGTWFQTSRSYRHVCRLPEGKTGKQALAEVDDIWTPVQIEDMGELSCGSHFLSMHAMRSNPELNLTLGNAEFQYYRSVGGGTYGQTGPANGVKGQKWELSIGPVIVAIVSAENPDAAVAAVFSPHWRALVLDAKTLEWLEWNDSDRSFAYQSPHSHLSLVVREVLNRDSGIQWDESHHASAESYMRSDAEMKAWVGRMSPEMSKRLEHIMKGGPDAVRELIDEQKEKT